MLNQLGFPTGTDVTSRQEVSFDISGFLTMIEGLAQGGGTYCNFRLVVSDGNGTTEKTIQLKVRQQNEFQDKTETDDDFEPYIETVSGASGVVSAALVFAGCTQKELVEPE